MENHKPLSGSDAKIEEYTRRYDAGEISVLEDMPRSMREVVLTKIKNPSSLLEIIPIQDREFAAQCADIGEEGIEIFTEMNIPKIYTDPEMNEWAQTRYKKMIEAVRNYSKRNKLRSDENTRLRAVKEQLGTNPAQEELTATTPIDSIDLPNKEEVYTVTGEIEGVHYNKSHGQDAFSVNRNENITCVTVCDGISSRAGSGELSSRLAKQISADALTKTLSEIVDPESLRDILEDIKSVAGKLEGGAGSTLVSVRIDKNEKTIEWTSIGDSPLFVIDTDENGEVVSWEILTEDNSITNENYTDIQTLETLKDPATHCVGIKNDTVNIPKTDRIKTGLIPYTPGRKIVVASDFITKVMLHSPEVTKARSEYWKHATNDDEGNPYSDKKKEMMHKVWNDVAERNEQNFKDLWTINPATNELMFNPLSMAGKSPEELRTLLDEWMRENSVTTDDVTIMTIDLDKYFRD
ncbi:MAG: protein phosphatase 2C domain-containing protein [Patescibacteria group bacterium]